MTGGAERGGWATLRRLAPILLAIGAGVGVGELAPEVGELAAPFGRLYVSLLLMCVIPILGAAVVSSLGRMVATHRLGRNLVGILVVFWGGMLLSATIGTGIGWVTRVGADLETSAALGDLLLEMEGGGGPGGGEATGEEADAYVELFAGSPPRAPAAGGAAPEMRGPRLLTYLDKLIPGNLVAAYLEDNYLAVLFFSVLLGVALGLSPGATRDLALGVLEAMFNSLLRIITWVIWLLPLGLFCLVAGQVAAGGLAFVVVFRRVILVSLVTTVATMVLFTVTIWKVRGGTLAGTLRGMREPLLIAFATSSSFASIPAAMVALKDNFGLGRENVNLFLPLGITMNPIGSALFFSLSSIFAVQLHGSAGLSLAPFDAVMLILGSVLAGIAAMGLPGVSALWMLGLVLEPIGVPPEVGIVALVAVAPIIDPLFTMVNVYGNCTATCILDRYVGR